MWKRKKKSQDMKKWMCMISLACFSKRKCHFNPLDFC